MAWEYHTEGSPAHVWPQGDTIEHDTTDDNGGCICKPRTEEVPREDGTTGHVISHNAMDGRPE
ncbi:hypothetical protein SEA_COLUCCI_60 [Arthrobacter phage Colucci]|uniref:Uncharacterized protein n=1 Tax=Arthrobacter phage Colucci TaxID=2015834 RepID=A0A286N2X2_9CAUD|nr:hypothetical protein FDI27_gp060 [Arthrobacter phage Colucci]ASX98729.1 hypothetical protein SEA_COLUCCI_60 [Arthrobacter phage Colucci]